jgi:hypothetical protein
MKTEHTKRYYEVSGKDLVDFVLDDPHGFELLRTQLAEAYAPNGLDEEDCVYQMAKSLFLKRELPTKRSRMKGFTEAETVDQINYLLLTETSERKIQSGLDSLGGQSIEYLRKHCPRAP